jgi:hypothetical protein
MLRLALALMVGAAAWAAAPSPASADDRFLSEEGRFRVAFPRPPQEDAKAGDDGRYHRFRAEVDGVTYSVDWTDLAAEEIRKTGEPEILLHRLRDALARDKTVLAEKPLPIGGSPGVEIVFDLGSGNRRIFHLYKVGPRLYTLAVTGKTERMRTQQQLVERFFESFGVRTVPPRKIGPLAVKAAEPRYGKLGPPRKDWQFLPYDVLTARLSVAGFATDDEGHVDLDATTEILAADGTVVFQEPFRVRGVVIDEILPLNVTQQLPVKPGEYRVKVSLHDLRSGERTVWNQPFTRLPEKPALVAAAFYRDGDAKLPAPAFVRLGEKLFIETRFIGFDRSRDTIDTSLSLQLFDEQGRPMLAKPNTASLKTEDKQVVRSNEVVTFMMEVPCPRIGRVRLQATATDHASGQTAVLELPLEIHEP